MNCEVKEKFILTTIISFKLFDERKFICNPKAEFYKDKKEIGETMGREKGNGREKKKERIMLFSAEIQLTKNK